MVACDDCKQEMPTAATCTADALVLRDERFERIRQVRPPVGRGGRCGDCGIRRGGFHHFGCDMEPCPHCHRQLLSCGCCDDPDDKDGEAVIAVADGVAVYPAGLRGLHVPAKRYPFGSVHDEDSDDDGGPEAS